MARRLRNVFSIPSLWTVSSKAPLTTHVPSSRTTFADFAPGLFKTWTVSKNILWRPGLRHVRYKLHWLLFRRHRPLVSASRPLTMYRITSQWIPSRRLPILCFMPRSLQRRTAWTPPRYRVSKSQMTTWRWYWSRWRIASYLCIGTSLIMWKLSNSSLSDTWRIPRIVLLLAIVLVEAPSKVFGTFRRPQSQQNRPLFGRWRE